MNSNTAAIIIVISAMWGAISLFHYWQDKKSAQLEKEKEKEKKEKHDAHAKERQTLDYFLSERIEFRDQMRGSSIDNPRSQNAYIVLYLDGKVWERLANLAEDDPMAIRLRLSFLDYLHKLRSYLGWIYLGCKDEDDRRNIGRASTELQKAKDMILTLLGEECRAVTRTAEIQGSSYFNANGTFRGENTVNLPPVIPP